VSSKSYLSGEARWSRAQRAKIERKLAELTDPRDLRLLQDRLDLKARRARYELREALRERSKVHVGLADYQQQLRDEMAYWTRLAEGYEQRIADSEDAPLFVGEDQ